jgi:SagB-type dehydrogenase family enzyme
MYDTSLELIKLPAVKDLPHFPIDLKIAVERRKTLRNYQQIPLTLDEMTFLLWFTQGVKEINNNKITKRTVPSAGARHAFETYLLINHVDGISPGLYRYLALEHALLPVISGQDITQSVTGACLDQQQISSSAITFIWVAIKERMYWRYGERGYRYLHLDAGHVCQNLCLGAEAIGSGVCAIAAFDDDQLNTVLELDGENRFVIYLGTVGKKQIE